MTARRLKCFPRVRVFQAFLAGLDVVARSCEPQHFFTTNRVFDTTALRHTVNTMITITSTYPQTPNTTPLPPSPLPSQSTAPCPTRPHDVAVHRPPPRQARHTRLSSARHAVLVGFVNLEKHGIAAPKPRPFPSRKYLPKLPTFCLCESSQVMMVACSVDPLRR
jgi:hypothetical protein